MKSLIAAIPLLTVASAQAAAWAQCGGAGWSGSTSCVNGYTCQFSNQYYSQCVPGSAPPATTRAATTRPATTTRAAASSTRATSTAPIATGSISKPNGLKFTIDGVTKYFAGTNCYWCGFLTNNADVDSVFNNMQSSGMKILRVWGFNDVNTIPGSGTVYYQYLSKTGSTINTGANGLQRLDYVVQAAEKRGIKLIVNFVNNWNDYGGINAYVTAFGGTKQSWFTDAASQNQYKAYIKAVVSRYSNSPGIFAWELGNEPRCQGCSTDVIYKWATSISQYIKSLDPKHMVTLGDEGFGLPGATTYPYGTSEGVDWVKNLNISTLDFGTFHLYPSSWGISNAEGNAWVRDHAAICKSVGKPCLFEEYGITTAGQKCAVEGEWQKSSLALKDAGMAGDLFWDWGDQLSTGPSNNDGNTIIYGSSDWECLVRDHVKAIG